MAEQPWQPTDPELERALADLEAHLDYPRGSGMRTAVGQRLRAAGAAEPGTFRRRWAPRRIVAVILVGLALAGGTLLAASPAARTAVARWLGLPGIAITYVSTPPALAPPATINPAMQPGAALHLGAGTTLSAAQHTAGYTVLVPSAPGLGQPDEVYLDAGIPGGQISLVYHQRSGLPRTKTTGVGLLLTEFRGDATGTPIFGKKLMPPGVHLQTLTVNGWPAFWLTGTPHYFIYTSQNGDVRQEQIRLAANTLVWTRNGLTLRLESALDKKGALRVATSLRPLAQGR